MPVSVIAHIFIPAVEHHLFSIDVTETSLCQPWASFLTRDFVGWVIPIQNCDGKTSRFGFQRS